MAIESKDDSFICLQDTETFKKLNFIGIRTECPLVRSTNMPSFYLIVLERCIGINLGQKMIEICTFVDKWVLPCCRQGVHVNLHTGPSLCCKKMSG